MEDPDSPLRNVTKAEIRDLLGKGWLTHDGMWFVSVAETLGIDRANTLNNAAIRSMSGIEARRIAEALGRDLSGTQTAGDLSRFLNDALALLLPESVSSHIRIGAVDPATVRLEWAPGECFAYKGMKRVGLLDGYQCGVIYRIECWMKALGIRHEVDPPTGLCRMGPDCACVTQIRLSKL